MSIELIMSSNHLILCCLLLLHPSIFPGIRVFQLNQFFASGGQSTGVSALASVLPKNIQDWFPLGWTGYISLLPKGLSRIFSNTKVQKHQSSALSFIYGPNFTSIHDYWKKLAMTRWTFVDQVTSLPFNVLSMLVITFIPRSKCLQWFWSPPK